MRPYHLALVMAVTMGLTAGTPLSERNGTLERRGIPAPHERASLAFLDGLPPCYGKCMISEAHLYKYNMFEQSLHDWCADYFGKWGHTKVWMRDHLDPCTRNNCEGDDFEIQATTVWWRRVCPH